MFGQPIGAPIALASGSWGVMAAGLESGALSRRDHDRVVADVNAAKRPPTARERDTLAFHDREGADTNNLAIASVLIGTALAVVGAALLVRGLVLRGREAWVARLGLRWQF